MTTSMSMTIARIGDAVARARGCVVSARWLVVALVVLLAHSYPCADAAHALTPLTGVKAVATGDGHACALTETGGVKCWGANGSGGLGDGSTADRRTPVNTVGLSSGIKALATGLGHTCALSAAGDVKCWGANNSGQLGDGSTTQRLTPVDVVGLSGGIKAIAAGESHTCALTAAGGVMCWGYNFYGQLGDGSTTRRLTAVDVFGLSGGIKAIAAGGTHTCALTEAGGVKCWGANFSGQLGDGSTSQRLTPVDVTGLASGVQAIAAGGGHGCAVTGTGGVKCWGANVSGQLGDGSTTDRLTPVDAAGLSGGMKAIAAGGSHSCALTEAGGATCWGDNYYGQLGDRSTANRLVPVAVDGLSGGVRAIAAGGGHSCAATETGGALCWGFNDGGQLGDGSTTQRLTPVDVFGLSSGMKAIAAGKSDHTCALTEGGGVRCWGMNLYGQLGDGSTTNRSTPVDVTGLPSGIKAIAAGDSHSCALTEAGGVKCWGNNFSGQLGDGSTTDRFTPVEVVGLSGAVKAVATGRSHTCALTEAGGVVCWGANFGGQLGDGSTTNRVAPVGVVGLSGGIKAVATGRGHTCALTDAGGAKCWGDNFSGQLGDGSTTQQLTPVNVAGLSGGIKAIAAGILHTCALTEAGAVKCWGDNYYGQLGDGSTTTRLTPVDVAGLSGGISLTSAGNLHTCALTVAGGVACWGDNFFGQLGDGSTTNRLTPVGVVGLSGGVKALSGGYHTCALTEAGGAKCWGDNLFGQLGDGTAGYRTYPMPVLVDDTAASPSLVSAKSRRVHGSAGTFEILLNAVATSPTTEPRSGGAGGNHTIVFTFDKPVAGGVAGVTAGTATAGAPTFDGNDMIVPLTGVSNQQYVTVSVSDVIAADGGTGGSGSVRVGFLLGDVNQNRVVTVSDLGLVNAQIAQLVSSANFLKDVNATGTLTVADKGIANTQITKALPAP